MLEEKIFISPSKKKLLLNESCNIKGISTCRYEAIAEQDAKGKQFTKSVESIKLFWIKQ
jgi:hypothetical protein